MLNNIGDLNKIGREVFETVDRLTKETIDGSELGVKPANVKFGYRELLGYIRKIFVGDQYLVKKYIKDGDIVFDAGANTGIFSIMAGLQVESGKVFAFEPTVDTFNVMKENTQPYKNIVAVNKALGDRSENVTVMTSGEDSAVNFIQDSDITKGTYEYNLTTSDIVPMTTIDEFVEENKLQKVNYIKMDTGGYERQVLLGAKETIKKFKPVLALSAYHLSGDKQDLPNLVKSIVPEYKYKLSYEYEEIFFFWI